MERWVAEIKLRAITRIGEISAELETVPHKIDGRNSDGSVRVASGGKPDKASVLKAAGISTSAAHRAEKLAVLPPVGTRHGANVPDRGLFADEAERITGITKQQTSKWAAKVLSDEARAKYQAQLGALRRVLRCLSP